MTSLKNQAVTSIKWTSVQTVFVGSIAPITLVIKSRFLTPDEFAYLSIILIVIGLFRLLENFGISQAIIQKDIITKQESSSIFFFNIFFSFILAILLFFTSSIIAGFYSMPKLDYYLKIVSCIVFINGPSLLFRAFLEKQMFFKQLSIIEMGRSVVMLFSIFLFLFYDFGVQGVIFAHILSTLFMAIAIIVITLRFMTIKLVLNFKFVSLLPFLRFGMFVSGKQLLTFLAHRADELVIGYLLSPEILGIYHFGKQMLERVRGLITKSFSKVLFPVFSKIKHNKERLSKSYQQISKYIAFGAFPIFIGIAVTAHLFVPVIFGEKWLDSVIVFQVFSIAMIFLLLTANVSSALLYSVKKPDLIFYVDLITNGAYFISLFLFASKGLLAILIVYSSYIIYKTITLQYFANKQLTQKIGSYLRELIKPAVFSLIMAIFILLFQYFTATYLSKTILLITSILIGSIIFGTLFWIFAKDEISELRKLLKGDTVNI